MNNTLHYLSDDLNWFPSPSHALDEPAGLLAIGGDLNPQRVFNGYQQGIFPWYSSDEPIMWWSPDPRAVINISDIRVNKSLRKFLNKCNYSVSINTQFDQVISHCAKPRPNSEGTWIISEMKTCYQQLHKSGHAHSIEVWEIDNNGKKLVGGLYGVLVGNCFCGESMFSLKPNASKLALICLANLLKDFEGAFIDCQLPNPYLMSMGASLISRDLYLERLTDSRKQRLPISVFSSKFIQWQTFISLYDYR
ncbi:leucyl/phenylalanyl-tRNA--protein transferase [Psychrosphaera sp. F3M07]|uniref:leucyl/phenylalanyl-tRNA--protein transferase n=1 Tax=Psychrosphaera sp. F3M07 TaxID=2841560 RepID=UPI001C0A33C7|nr:leucyl/phenylalanyl-tRNA--protein transferase [Psychrosphaera sp. F3M07]MBU2918911.1 leucyl/phenylalanyl-tRNA--protein transferase [Psychrosphaera sp. F3M07]